MSDFSDQDVVFMQRALELARQAAHAGEVPVGAVLVLRGEVVGEGWNRPIQSHDPTHHAEIMALRQAGQKLKNYRLPGTVLYVTIEPCVMCAGALIHARVEKLIYGTSEPRCGAVRTLYQITEDSRLNHQIAVASGLLQEECANLMQAFFQQRR